MTDEFLGHRAPAGQVFQHILDAFVRHVRNGLEDLAVGFDGLFGQVRVSFAQPFRKGFLGERRILFYQLDARDVGAQKIFDEFRLVFYKGAAAGDARRRVDQVRRA